jgi:hypothetical protein
VTSTFDDGAAASTTTQRQSYGPFLFQHADSGNWQKLTGWWVTSLCATASTTQWQGSNFRQPSRVYYARMGAFRTRMCLCGRSPLGRRPLCEFVSASKISVPRSSGDRFDDWVMGLQFEPSYLHHPVSANRAFPARRQIGRFCGHFRPVDSQILVRSRILVGFFGVLSLHLKNSVPGCRP